MHNWRCQTQLLFSRYLLFLPLLLILVGLPLSASAQDLSDHQIIAAIPGYLPPHYITNKDGPPSGFAIDVLNHVTQMAGLQVEYRNLKTWAAAHAALKSGEVDIIPDMGVLAERREKFDFSLPIETFSVALFVRSTSQDINGLDDLAGKRVATIQTNIAIQLLKNHPTVKRVVFDNIGSAIFALLSSDVDALIYPVPWVNKAAQEAGVDDRVKIAGKPLAEITRAMAVRKGNTALLARLNPMLARFRESNEYRAIYRKWFGKPKPYLSVQSLTWVLEFAIGIVFLSVIFEVVWRNRKLRAVNNALHNTIEERRQVEVSLNEQILRNELIIQTTHDGFFLVDMEGKIKDVNRAYCEMLGYSTHELLSMSLADIEDVESLEDIKQHIEKVIQQGGDRR